MKTAHEIFPDEDDHEEYQPMLNEFGEVLVQVDDKYKHGDSRVLYKIDSGYGYLQFGWGSCCGCDALQQCYTIEQVQELMDKLHSSIMLFDSPLTALVYFRAHDWEGDYDTEEEQMEFVAKCIVLLEGIISSPSEPSEAVHSHGTKQITSGVISEKKVVGLGDYCID